MSGIEIVGFVSGFVCVWLTVRENVWNWPVGLINSAAWFVLFFDAGLYLDSVLQLVYIALGIYGWYFWIFGGERRNEVPVTRLTSSAGTMLTASGVVAIVALTLAESHYTDTNVPLGDAATTIASLIALYLLSRKTFENWYLWIAVDFAYVGLYAYKGLYLTAVLQPLFIAMCFLGIRGWRRSMSRMQPSAAPTLVESGVA
jgi:nicotinamide mononucleotide transporter